MNVKVWVIYKPKNFMHGLKIAETLHILGFRDIEVELKADEYYVEAVRILDEKILTRKPLLSDALYTLGATLPYMDDVVSLSIDVEKTEN